MRGYNLTFILASSLAKEEQDKQIAKLKKMFEDAGGKVGQLDEWGKRELTFPIKKQTEGLFFNLNLELEGKEAKEAENKLKLEEKILRHLLIRKE